MQQNVYIPVGVPWQSIVRDYLRTLSRQRRREIAEELGVNVGTLDRMRWGQPVDTRVSTVQGVVRIAAAEGALPQALVIGGNPSATEPATGA